MSPGGKYDASGAVEFNTVYRAALEAGMRSLHMTERPDPKRMPLLVDLDFR